ncbi:hypothetical protein BSR29_03875 [Boudabousia liubingyangii]|uniref:RNA 2-O ribose methyltransferase substrate binding domain-containing protein n=1 Tax=Boudabousia liubingyangii TaxID=1921764 RepID=A0A1Q5PNF8_9ACTO|nr:RNA methyltransferase [Boudabousia liubingyangii]OKL47561.1 hypothetical protein BSR28_03445 [Boudabousia liubingyangii]OKL48985.1 hypothetical protein BSR29_03875 [Boudabousia liubingyangii]
MSESSQHLFSDRVDLMDNPKANRVGFVSRLARRQTRQKYGLALVEGPQAVRELIRFQPSAIRDLYVDLEMASGTYRELVLAAREVTDFVHPCTRQVVDHMSSDAQGIVAVAELEKLPFHPVEQLQLDAGMAVLLARVQDPGNAGTMVRLADAFGAQAVLASAGTADLSSPKVLRSAVGSSFHLPTYTGQFSDLVVPLKKAGFKILGTSGEGAISFDDLIDAATLGTDPELAPVLEGPLVWVFGNEAKGLAPDEAELCDYLVSIPMYGQAESLNVASAAAVVLSGTARIRHRQ